MRFFNFKKINLIYLLTLLPIVNYNILASFALLLFFFTEKYNRSVLINLIVFFIFGIFVFITNANITIFKYLISIIVLLFLYNIKKEIKLSLFNTTTLLLLIFAIIESTYLRDSLRYFYRSSNIELHYNRYSCFFLFPGDLGAYSAIAISLLFLHLIVNEADNKKYLNIFYIVINFILILLSQSRMAFFHVLISFIIIVMVKPKYILFAFLLLPILILFQDKLSYLFREDLLYLSQTFFSSDASIGNKRAEELFEILNSTEGDLGYYEGSVPSFISRFGLFISPIIFLVVALSFYKFWMKINMKLTSLIVILPIIITSFISAPLERPKLLFFSIAAILVSFQIINNSNSKFKTYDN